MKTQPIGPFLLWSKAVEFCFCIKVCALRFFGGVEVSKIGFFTVNNDPRPKFVSCWAPANTKNSSFIMFVGASLVLQIFAHRGFAKVINTVIGWVSVSVIYKPVRPFSMNVQPRETVSLEPSIPDDYVAATFTGIRARPVASFCSPARNAPRKFSSCGVVMKQLAKALCGKFFFYNACSHDDSSKVRLVRACVAVQTPHRLA